MLFIPKRIEHTLMSTYKLSYPHFKRPSIKEKIFIQYTQQHKFYVTQN